jgi:AcrR family transcriptional regulator
MTLILDHAEAEFAAKGYNGTTLASVAAIAGIDTSLMRYYFGDKEHLFAAVFRRRGPLINAARYKALEAYRQKFGERGTLEGLIDAFVRPGFEFAQLDEGHRNYAAIVAYVNSSRGAMHSLMSEVFDEVSKVLIDEMQRLMPDAPREALYWGYHFLTGAFTFSLGQTGRIDRISDGVVSSSDFPGIADRLPAFVAAGIRALCTPLPQEDGSPDRAA